MAKSSKVSPDGKRTYGDVRATVLKRMVFAQAQAAIVGALVATFVNGMFDMLPGRAGIATDAVARAAAAFAKDAAKKAQLVQPLPDDVMGYDGTGDGIKAADLSADTKAELQRAADCLNNGLDLKFVNGSPKYSWKQGAEINEGLNLADGVLINALQNLYTEQQIAMPLICMYARQLFIWPAFHAAITTLFADFTDPTSVAKLKTFGRAAAKQFPHTGDYVCLLYTSPSPRDRG